MMWNFLVGCLLSDAAIVLYDGSPAHPDLGALWSLAERARITCMGRQRGLLASCEKAGIEPARDYDLSALRAIGSTGSPLAPESFQWVYEHVGADDLAVLDERRHRRLHGVRRRLPAAAGLRGRTAVPRARLRGRGLGRAGQRAHRRGRRARDHRADALDAAVPVGRRGRRAAARELLRDVSRASGATATGSASRRAAARSSTGARTRRSTARACAWARARSTARRARVPEVLDALVVDIPQPGGDGELRMMLFVVLRDGVTLDDDAGARDQAADPRGLLAAPRARTRSARSPRCRARSRARCSRCRSSGS